MDRVGNTEGVVSGEREVVSEMDIGDTISRIRRLISSDSRARASDEEDREALAENEDQVRPLVKVVQISCGDRRRVKTTD